MTNGKKMKSDALIPKTEKATILNKITCKLLLYKITFEFNFNHVI